MVAAVLCLSLGLGQAGPPLFGLKAGVLKFETKVSVGAPEQKTGIRGDGTTVYVVQIDGVANTPAGRSVDGLYTFVDQFTSFPIPAKNSRIQLLNGKDNLYRDWEFYRPSVGDAYPAFQTNNSYKFLWKPSPSEEISVVSPNLKWTSPADDPLAGTYFLKISTAVKADAVVEEKTTLSAVDCQEFIDSPGNVPVQPAPKEPTAYWVNKMAVEGRPLKGIAADGATVVILRSVSPRPGRARFAVSGPGGLYPLGTMPYGSRGSATIEAPLRPLANGKFVALALYRSPETLAAVKEASVRASVTHLPSDGSASIEATTDLKLVRPPVILVHGTYDNPRYCWDSHEVGDESPTTMREMLAVQGFRVFLLDWEETNGMKDPSSFVSNEKTLLMNRGGINDALSAMRSEGTAVTQVDIVCHSQGGVISRVYARGHNLNVKLATDHPHFTNPERCAADGCWYHRANNYSRGDIHRFITISSTHRGSDVCRVFQAFNDYQGALARSDNSKENQERMDIAIKSLVLQIFLTYVNTQVSGITTQGFLNQVPGSPELRQIGPTPVPAHAIACVATDEQMKNVRKDTSFPTKGMGNYYGKLYKIFIGTTDEALLHVIKTLGTKEEFETYSHELGRYRNEYAQLSESGRQYQLDKVIYLIRRIVFANDENDCTVSMLSSFGGLGDPFRYKAEGVLHGWAPRYPNVQVHVAKLLTDSGGMYDRRGFPDSYTGVYSRAETFGVPTLGTPEAKPIVPVGPTTGTGTTTSKPGGLDLGDGNLGKNQWTQPDGTDGTARIEADQLAIEAVADGFGVRTFSKLPVSGNFDLVIDYKLEKWNPGPTASPSFDIFLSPSAGVGGDFVQVSRSAIDASEEFVFTSIDGTAVPAVKGKSGRLRIERKGRQWTVSQADGPSWTPVASFTKDLPGQVYLGFGLTPNGPVAAKVTVRPRLAGTQETILSALYPPSWLPLHPWPIEAVPGQQPRTSKE